MLFYCEMPIELLASFNGDFVPPVKFMQLSSLLSSLIVVSLL